LSLRKEEGVKLVHKAVIEGGKVFETLRTCFLQSCKEKDLGFGVELFKKLAQLRHGITPSGDTENIVNQAFDKLLGDVFAAQIRIRKFS
jgi:hypothetical protein